MKCIAYTAVLLLLVCFSAAAQAPAVPEAQWTPQEAAFIAQARQSYHSQGMAFTDEQAELAVGEMRRRMAQMTGQAAALQAMAQSGAPLVAPVVPAPSVPAPSAASPPVEAVSEVELQQSMDALGAPVAKLQVESHRDGLYVNGQPYLDPEGAIVQFAYDAAAGNLGYLVEMPDGYLVKVTRANGTPPLRLAVAGRTSQGWDVQTVTGQHLSGSTLSVLSDGLLVSRSASAFRYVPGKGVIGIAMPDGFVLTPMQRGNVGATGFVLLEREGGLPAKGSFSAVTGSVKALGSTLGIGKKEDYALFALSSGQIIPLNISVEDKQVVELSQCRSQSKFVNRCEQAETFESLYEPDGDPNNQHYYWRANWFSTPAGPIAVTQENGSKDLFIVDLASGRKVTAFKRALGIARWDAVQDSDGVVRVTAGWSFKQHTIDDALAWLQSGGAMEAAAASEGAEEPAENP